MAVRHPHPSVAHRPPLAVLDVVALVGTLLAGPVLLAASRLLVSQTASTPAQELARVVGLAAGAAGILLLLWWSLGLLGLAVTVLGTRLGRPGWQRVGTRLTPALFRRAAAALLGLQVLAAPVAWAEPVPTTARDADTPVARVAASWLPPAQPSASPAAHPAKTAEAARPTTAPTPGPPQVGATAPTAPPSPSWLPHAPVPAPPGAAATPRPGAEARTVTVRAGDCLWDLAEAELGPDATPIEIDLRWRQWHSTNHAVIGDDPHLLLPGTVLTVPQHSPHVHDDTARR